MRTIYFASKLHVLVIAIKTFVSKLIRTFTMNRYLSVSEDEHLTLNQSYHLTRGNTDSYGRR